MQGAERIGSVEEIIEVRPNSTTSSAESSLMGRKISPRCKNAEDAMMVTKVFFVVGGLAYAAFVACMLKHQMLGVKISGGIFLGSMAFTAIGVATSFNHYESFMHEMKKKKDASEESINWLDVPIIGSIIGIAKSKLPKPNLLITEEEKPGIFSTAFWYDYLNSLSCGSSGKSHLEV